MNTVKRTCGDCAACCKTHAVMSLNKGNFEWCTHCVKHRSCGIYQNRPVECRDFECDWLKGRGDENKRPDRLRVVSASEELEFHGSKVRWCSMLEVTYGALKRDEVVDEIRSLVESGAIVETIDVRGQQSFFASPKFSGSIESLYKQLRKAFNPLDETPLTKGEE